MYDPDPIADEPEATPPGRTARAARLPAHPLSRALELCAQIQRDGEEATSPEDAAHRAGMSATSSTYKQRLAAARAFGLIQGRGQIRLTPRALQCLAGGQPGISARLDAVMDSGFGGVIEQMDDQPALERPVASVLVATGLVSRSAARPLARSLISSAQSAGIVSGGRFRLHDARGRMRLLDQPSAADIPPQAERPGRSRPTVTPPLGVIEIRLGDEVQEALARIADALERLAPEGRADARAGGQ